MTITSTASQISYDGDGVSVAFSIPFPFDTSADLKVTRTEDVTGTIEILTTGFTVSGGGGSTGTLTMATAPASGFVITILDNPSITQTADYTDNDAFAAATHERALDRGVRISKRIAQLHERAFRIADGDPTSTDDMILPAAALRAGKYLSFDDDGNPTLAAIIAEALTQSTFDTFDALAPLSRLIYNAATTFDAYGDSITYGVAGTSSVDAAYINLLADRRGWAVVNHAVNGSMVADQADYVYVKTVGDSQQSTLMLGTNDFRFYKEDVHKMLAYQRGHMALAAWLAIPATKKITGQSASAVAAGTLIYTGTWVDNTAVYGSTLGRYSAVPGSTVTAGVYGSTVYLGTIIIDGGTSTFEVTIDGVSYGVFQNSCASGNIVSINGRGYMPQVLRFSGLSENSHEVKITVLTIGLEPIYFDWAAGNLGAATKDGPNLWVGNIPRLSTVGYATYGGTDNDTVQMYNELIRDNVSLLAADGLNVQLVDSQSRFNNATMLDADGIHPNDAGHEAIAQAWQESLNQVAKPGTRVTKPSEPVALAVRNLVTNGNFQINQRAVSGAIVLAANAYAHDMWKAGASGCSYTFAKSGNITTITISAGSLVQVIAGDLIQQTRHVVSWQGTAKGRQYLTGTYTNGAFLLDLVPGTNAAIEFGIGTLKLVQVEAGTRSTPFEYRSYASELAASQQYLAVFDLPNNKKLGVGHALSATTAVVFVPFKNTMRSVPTGVTVSGTFSLLGATGTLNTATLAFDSATADAIAITATAAGGLVAGNASLLCGLAAGKIIVTGAEL